MTCPTLPRLLGPIVSSLLILAGTSAAQEKAREYIPTSDDYWLQVIEPKSQRNHTVTDIAVTRDGESAFGVLIDGTIREWNCQTGEELRSIRNRDSYLQQGTPALSNDGKYLALLDGGSRQKLQVWELERGRRLFRRYTENRYSEIAVTLDGSQVVVWNQKSFRCWQILDGKPLESNERTLNQLPRERTASLYQVRGGQPNPDLFLILQENLSGRELHRYQFDWLKVKPYRPSVSQHSLAANLLVATSVPWPKDRLPPGELYVYDLRTGEKMWSKTLSSDHWPQAIAISPDGKRVVTAGYQRTDLKQPEQPGDRPIAFSTPDRVPSFQSTKNSLHIWDAATGELEAVFRHPKYSIGHVVFSPYGRRIVFSGVAVPNSDLAKRDGPWHAGVIGSFVLPERAK